MAADNVAKPASGEAGFRHGRSLIHTFSRHAAGFGQRAAMARADRSARPARGPAGTEPEPSRPPWPESVHRPTGWTPLPRPGPNYM